MGKRSTGATFTTYTKGLYYENIHGDSPQTLRLISIDGDYLIGSVFGKKHKVLAKDYQLARTIGEV